MQVLIVVPRYVSQPGEFYQFPLGLAYIAAAVEDAGHEVVGLNLNHAAGDVADLVAAAIAEHDPAICATGGLSPFLPCIKQIFSAARAAKPDIVNIAGGGVVSSDAAVAPEIMDIDIGVVGEGEGTIAEILSVLAAGQSIDEISGIVYRAADGEIVTTPARPAIMDLTQIPRANYAILGFGDHLHLQNPLDHHFLQTQLDNRPRAIDIITSRSCPYSCTFCFHPVGKVYRERPLDDVFEELTELIDRYDINLIGIIDELFSLRKARLLEFCERIKPLNVKWMVQLHVNSADEHILDAMRDAGCVYISYGIESMSPPVLISMMKKSKKERIELSLQRTKDRKIGIQGNLIFGDTVETLETASESMDWWAKNRHYPVNLSRLQVFPGSPDYIAAVRDGLIDDRVAYALELPVFLNISRVNDGNMDLMTALLWAQGRSLLKLAPLHSFEHTGRHEERSADLYDIKWGCPGCGYENHYTDCIVPPGEPHSLRLFCRECLDRWDIQNTSRKALPVPETLAKEMAAIDGMIAGKQFSEARILIGKLIERAPESAEVFDLKARLSLERQDLETELRSRIFAVGHAPFHADYHARLADCLARAATWGAALLHLEQSLMLEPDHAQARALQARLLSHPNASERAAVYFPDLADGPAPARPERDRPSYDRKKEPAFPLFSRSANRASINHASSAGD